MQLEVNALNPIFLNRLVNNGLPDIRAITESINNSNMEEIDYD